MTKFILFKFQFPSIEITLTAKEEDDGSKRAVAMWQAGERHGKNGKP
jgi:hypothetical protein